MTASTTDLAPDSLSGQFLIAMPEMGDPRFERSVIYLCVHSGEGATGLVVNRPAPEISFPQLLEQLNIDLGSGADQIRVHAGGPVERSRGFVLHSTDYRNEDSTLSITSKVGLTATVDILEALAHGIGPRQALLALGYAGWAPGQLEQEILNNVWLNAPADPDLLFSGELDAKWEAALARIGVDMTLLSRQPGNA